MLFRKRRVYADAAAATPMSYEAMSELVRLLPLYGNPGALHAEGQAAKVELEKARKSIAESIGAHADEIVFTASGTEGNNLALHGALRPLMRKATVHAITIAVEHQSVLEPLRALAREGAEVTELSVDSEGLIDAKQVADALQENTALVSIQLVNSEVGTLEPVREVAKVLRKHGKQILLHCDAAQAPLWLNVKVDKLGVDLMTIDAQKVLGPKGVGALYIRRGVQMEAILWGGKQEFGLRGGTENAPKAASFAVALAAAQAAPEERAAKVAEVREYLWEEIKKVLPDALCNGPLWKNRVANNLNVSVPGLNADMAVIALDAEGIAVSTRSACNIGDEEPSHVIKAIGIPPELAGTAIRITLLPDVTRADAKRIATTLADVAKRYRTG